MLTSIRHKNTVSGYYRFTDVFYEWIKVLPAEQGAAIKAIFDNPLHVDGIDGIQLTIGAFNNGESRLLVSSAQVEYARYWLYQIKITDTVVPMMYSNCLLTPNDVKTSPVIYRTGGDIKKGLKEIDKTNKRLKGAKPLLTSRRHNFERLRTLYSERIGTWLVVDIEEWERDHTVLTEFGYSIVRFEDGAEVTEDRHFIIEEHQFYRNGTYVEENRENYMFGESEIIHKALFKLRVQKMFEEIIQSGPVFLIFHNSANDIKSLKSPSIEVPLEGLVFHLPDGQPDQGIFVVDTAELFAAVEGNENQQTKSLRFICQQLDISTDYMHNAGNDAHYTRLVLQALIGKDTLPIDMQREARWPNRTGDPGTKSVQVKWTPYELDPNYISDDDDDEFPQMVE